jgi:hypothetical protein
MEHFKNKIPEATRDDLLSLLDPSVRPQKAGPAQGRAALQAGL